MLPSSVNLLRKLINVAQKVKVFLDICLVYSVNGMRGKIKINITNADHPSTFLVKES